MPELNLNAFQFLEYAAWAVSIVLGGWMLVDLIATDRAYSEDLLISSKEGELEDILGLGPPPGGRR